MNASPKDKPGGNRASLRLDQRFAIAGSIVMLLSMAALGNWVSQVIQTGVTNNSALAAAVYMESVIAPLSQELSVDDTVAPETGERLKALFAKPPLSGRIISVKLWKPGGLIAFSTNSSLIGKRFPPSDHLKEAWQGTLSASFDELSDDENASERNAGLPLLEVYNPIHSILDGEIIAVAEFYQNAEELEADLTEARFNTWLIVAAAGLLIFALLYGIVKSGSNLIERQHGELRARLREVVEVSRLNDSLRRRIQQASLRSSELQEHFLRRVSAELHDGPAQALALASLRLGSLAANGGKGRDDEVGTIRQALDQALGDIRNLCRGLSLPEIEGRPLSDVLQIAIRNHERLTGSAVRLEQVEADVNALKLDHSTLICAYRFVQEGLMNAYRHGDATGQTVSCALDGSRLHLCVSDSGPGFDPLAGNPAEGGLGLRGLRERIESIGGAFAIQSAPGAGARLTMSLDLAEENNA